jgi:hypothetical protein
LPSACTGSPYNACCKPSTRAIPGASRWLANGEPGSVTLEGQTDFSVVTLANKIEIFRDGQIVNEIPYLDANGNPIVGGGSKTDQIAFSLDNRLLFVAGAHGNIHVIDTATMRRQRQASASARPTSAVSPFPGSGSMSPRAAHTSRRAAIVSCASTSTKPPADFLAIQQIELPATVSGQNAPYGYIDMALTHGAHSYLAVTASKQSVGVAMARSQPDSGNVFILDLDQLLEARAVSPPPAPALSCRSISRPGKARGRSTFLPRASRATRCDCCSATLSTTTRDWPRSPSS